MGAVKGFAVRLRALFAKRAVEHDLDEEIRFHLGPGGAAAGRMIERGGAELAPRVQRDPGTVPSAGAVPHQRGCATPSTTS